MQHFRKYGFPNASAWDTAKAEIEITTTNPEGEEVKYLEPRPCGCGLCGLGNLCQEWGTDAEGNQNVHQAIHKGIRLTSFGLVSLWLTSTNTIVWPLPVGVSSMGYTLDTEYAKAYCVANPSAAYCQPPVPPVEL
jgi:hypothetical protein